MVTGESVKATSDSRSNVIRYIVERLGTSLLVEGSPRSGCRSVVEVREEVTHRDFRIESNVERSRNFQIGG